jgi:eukaryotic-like serine/threonine-protein kinase
MKPSILVVEEERELRDWLRRHIEILWPEGSIEELQPAQFEARVWGSDGNELDLIVLGARCGDALTGSLDAIEALEQLRAARASSQAPPVVVIATGGNELSAVRAIQLGASDYLPRRLLNAQRLASALRGAMRGPRQPAPARARPPAVARRGIDGASLQLPQYTLLHKLGESTRAAVFLAYSVKHGRNVALKISKTTPDGSNDYQEFAREYAAISALQHPSVVGIYDYGFHDGREFIAMEYFPCGDLKTRLQQPITTAESLEFTQRICAALHVVHAAGLLHRDLKPPNVMLRADGSIVLIDFGLAKQLEFAHLNTAVGMLRGSPYYMSPEQAQGLPLDARSDLYSAGVILFEMLTGRKPYLGATAVEVMQQHVQGPRPALPSACAALEPLLERLMARNRDERFADAQDAEAALSDAISLLRPASVQLPAAVSLQ